MADLVPQPGPLPLRVGTRLTQPFWEGCAAGELRYVRCSECGTADFPPAEHCRTCLTAAPPWHVSTGTGTVYSWTVVWRPVTPDFTAPYAPAIVDLDEGWSMMTNIVGCSTEDLAVGMRVRVQFAEVADGITLPYFSPSHTSP